MLDAHLASRARRVHELVAADDDARRARRAGAARVEEHQIARLQVRLADGRGSARNCSATVRGTRDPVSARTRTRRSRCSRTRTGRCRRCGRAPRAEPVRFPRPRQARLAPARDPAAGAGAWWEGAPGDGNGRGTALDEAQRGGSWRKPGRRGSGCHSGACGCPKYRPSTRRTDKSGGRCRPKPL